MNCKADDGFDLLLDRPARELVGGRPLLLPVGLLRKSVGEGGKYGPVSELEGAAFVIEAGTDKDTQAVMSGALPGTSELRWSTLVAFWCPIQPRLLPRVRYNAG